MNIAKPFEFEIEYVKRTEPFTMAHYHHHDIYEIYYLLSGERYYFIKDRTYHIQKGDLVLIPENMLHKTSWHGQPQHERILINFKPQFLLCSAPHETDQLLSPFLTEAKILRLHPLEQMQVEEWLQLMRKENVERPYSRMLVRSLLTQLLVFAARLVLDKKRTTSESMQPRHQRIYEVIDYINKQYSVPLRLNDLAEQFHISPTHLSRTFKAVTGFSFVEYLNAVRVKEAQTLLRETDLKIIDIAEQAGFDNLSHFGRVFKQISSTTPRQYRKLHSKG